MQRMHIPLVHSHSPSSSLAPTAGALLRQRRLPMSVRVRISLTPILYLSAYVFTAFSSKVNQPEPGTGQWIFQPEDVKCAEVWLRVSFVKTLGPQPTVVTSDGVTIASMTVNCPGTPLVEEDLQASGNFSSANDTRDVVTAVHSM